jgi:hypothetical protein
MLLRWSWVSPCLLMAFGLGVAAQQPNGLSPAAAQTSGPSGYPAAPEPGPAKPQQETTVEASEDEEGFEAPASPRAATTTSTPGANPLGPNTARGEARRNENVQVNLVDNNAARDANQRVGPTATIVDEFRPERSYYTVEFGNGSRGTIHANVQSGSGFHGNLFWSHNNSIFTARSFFQATPVQPARQNQYGAAFAAPLWKGAFFSFNGSQDKNRGMVNGNVVTLLPNERTPLATDPATRAIVQTILDAFPPEPPNRLDIAPRALNLNRPQTMNANIAAGQLNQKIGERDALVFRYSFTGQQVDAFQFVRSQNPNTDIKSHTSRLGWNRAWSPATVTDFTFGFDRVGTLLAPADAVFGPIFVSGIGRLGPQNNIPLDRAANQWLTGFGMQRRAGRHAYTAGITVTRRQYNGVETDGHLPIFQFRNDFGNDVITNLRLGKPSQYFQSFGDVYRGFRNWDITAYAGDHWTVSNALALNYAVRWEPTTRPIDVTRRSDLPFDSDLNNVGGAFGFAQRLPNGLGVLRGAFGIFFGQIYFITYSQDRLNRPWNTRIQSIAPDLVHPMPPGFDPSNIDPNTPTQGFNLSPDLATPYSYQYNFSWETELHRGWRLQLGYVGSRSHKLFTGYILNRAGRPPGVPLTLATINERRADKTKLDQLLVNNGSNGYYDAARATLTVPNFHGLTFSTSYWFSKSIDLGADYNSTAGDPNRLGQGGQTEFGVLQDRKGLSDFDQPHAFLAQASYDVGRRRGLMSSLYRNWTFTSVTLIKSGTPFDVNSGSDGPGFGNVDGSNGDRPHLLNPSILGMTIGHPDMSLGVLNASNFAFMNAAAGDVRGNLGKNTFRKGKIGNLNVSVQRTWALPHDLQMTFRAESINFTNTPQFAAPGNQLASPNFGQITNTLNDGRTFRFMLRFAF